MKKLLTLLGSVAVISSTAAVAIACEGKPLSLTIKSDSKELKNQLESSAEESNGEAKNKAQGDEPGTSEEDKEKLNEELEKAKKDFEDAKKESRLVNQSYQDALKKGKPYEEKPGTLPREISKEIDDAENKVKEVNQKLVEAKEKLEKLEKAQNTK
ncbi:lipoprotein [Mycoplasma mycoides subsp. capri]|nr:lipoprotein [Mycoplasma mycoides subsp. capri]